jgi:HipA-like kinase
MGKSTSLYGESVSTVVRVMSLGGGFPSLVKTTAGRHLIMKLRGVGQGTPGLLTEFIALRLASALGLKVPHVVPIMLSNTLPWQVGTDEFYEALQRSSGWNLGVEFIDTSRDLMADDLEDIPSAFLDRLAAVDALLQNVDRTAQNPNLLRDATGNYWAIDFGACLFLDRFARYRQLITFELPSNHFLAGRRLQLLQVEDADVPLQEIVSEVPDSWLGAGGRETLLDALSNILKLYVQRAAHGREG